MDRHAIEEALTQRFLDLLRTWESRDDNHVETFLSFVGQDYSGFGTGKKERYADRPTLLTFLQQEVEEMPVPFSIGCRWSEARVLAPTVGLVEADTVLTMPAGEEESVSFDFRFSTVWHLIDGAWCLVHSHGSLPATEQPEGETLPIDALRARNLQLEREVAVRTRELEVEAAVERVRAKALGMREPDDILDVLAEISTSIRQFNVDGHISSWVWIIDDDGIVTQWDLSEIDAAGNLYSVNITLDLVDFPMAARIMAPWPSGEVDYWVIRYTDDELERLISEIEGGFPEAGRVFRETVESGHIPQYIQPCARYTYGLLGLDLTAEPSSDVPEILPRMATAFGLAYQRYLDLRESESANREAQIEAAVERVRSRALAMDSSDELLDVIHKIHQEYASLGLPCEVFWQTRYTQESYHKAVTSVGGTRVSAIMELPRDFSMVPELATWERGSEKIGVFQFNAEAAASYVHHMNTKGHFHQVDPEGITPEIARELGGFTFVQARTLHGEIGYALWGEAEPTQEAKNVLVRFTSAFDLAYRRFEDLQQAEADHQALLEEKALTEQALDELKRTQAQLIQQEKLASLGQLTAGIAHEIKNPLNFVTNFADVSSELADEIAEALASGSDPAPLLAELKQTTSVIGQHGRRADGIVKSMMQHARASSGEREVVDLNKLVAEHIALAHHGRRARTPGFDVALTEQYDEAVGTVTVQPQELGRVIVNLVGNAFDAVADMARESGDDFEPTVRVSTARDDAQVTIRVADNGPGIPPDLRAKIFEPFFTTKPTGSGTGLGLSMSYDIVTQGHGGTLTVEDAPGGGAVLIVRLPASALASNAMADSPPTSIRAKP